LFKLRHLLTARCRQLPAISLSSRRAQPAACGSRFFAARGVEQKQRSLPRDSSSSASVEIFVMSVKYGTADFRAAEPTRRLQIPAVDKSGAHENTSFIAYLQLRRQKAYAGFDTVFVFGNIETKRARSQAANLFTINQRRQLSFNFSLLRQRFP
jgi:hypothetical protein